MQCGEVLVLPWLSSGAEENFFGLRGEVKISLSQEIKSPLFPPSSNK
jgi:hypothetical protein